MQVKLRDVDFYVDSGKGHRKDSLMITRTNSNIAKLFPLWSEIIQILATHGKWNVWVSEDFSITQINGNKNGTATSQNTLLTMK